MFIALEVSGKSSLRATVGAPRPPGRAAGESIASNSLPHPLGHITRHPSGLLQSGSNGRSPSLRNSSFTFLRSVAQTWSSRSV